MTKLSLQTIIAIVLLSITSITSAETRADDEYSFEVERRINAHGDEFMALAQTTDGRYLIVGAESGKLLIWSVVERRIVKELDQRSAVHCVVALNDADTFVAAGGPHDGPTNRAVIRKWHISTGKSEAWDGITDGSVFSLVYDRQSELIVADTITGKLAVWNSTNGALLTRRSFDGPASGLAIDGKDIYRTQISLDDDEVKPNTILRFRIDLANRQPTRITKEGDGAVWGPLSLSPNHRYLAARTCKESAITIVVHELPTQKTIGTFPGQNFAWSADGRLVIFDQEVATTCVTIDAHGHVTQTELLKGAQWHGAGSPANMTGQIVSADGSTAWEVFQLGAALVELDLNKKTFAELYFVMGYLHALDVRESLNLLATGGDDGFVRVRKLSDFSLVKEFKVEPGVPQGVTLMEDGRHVVFSASSDESPTRISVGDLGSGESRTLFDVPKPYVTVHAAADGFVYSRGNNIVLARWTDGVTVREFPIEGELDGFAVSANGEWLVVANETGSLFRFDIRKGTRTPIGAETIHSLTGLTISSDGRYVYTTEFGAKLRQWNTQTNVTREIGSIRGQARNLRLSRDEKEIVIGGNHRDVALYDIATGERRLDFEIAAADFYVTNVWLSAGRLLFSTDAGVLFDGRVKR